MSESAWTDLGRGLLVRQSAAFQMNSVLLLDREHGVLVDPGVLPSELDDIARVVEGARPARLALIFTHAHWDHVVGRPWWPAAETIAHDRFHAEVRRSHAEILAEIRSLAERHGETWTRGFAPLRPDQPASGLRFIRLGPWRLVLRDAPGHCDSQLSVHLPDQSTLLAADMLSDIEIPTLEGPSAPYRRALEDLLPLAEHGAIETVVPGHGSVARGRDATLERLRRDLDYLARLEAGVTAARAEGLSPEATVERLSGMDYGGKKMEDGARKDHQANVHHECLGLAAGPGPSSRAR